MARDPFRTIDLVIEFVDSAAGSRKTFKAIDTALLAADGGRKTMIAMPTLALIGEMVAHVRRDCSVLNGTVRVFEITSGHDAEKARRFTVNELLGQHIVGKDHRDRDTGTRIGGQVLFVTHEVLNRMIVWPPETIEWELIIDEVPEVILTRRPFQLRDSHYVLTSFLEVSPAPTSAAERRARRQAKAAGVPEWTARDERLMAAAHQYRRPGANASPGEFAQAGELLDRLVPKKAAWEKHQADNPDLPSLLPYYTVEPKLNDDPDADDPWSWLKRRVYQQKLDDVYSYLDPIPAWLYQEASLFTDQIAWDRMVGRVPDPLHPGKFIPIDFRPDRGRITISGFRRPDYLAAFRRRTIMSALFQHTMLYGLWEQLGVRFLPSTDIDLHVKQTPLGERVLRIYWLTDQGWSKRMRDRAGGIGPIFDLIVKSGAFDLDDVVCICPNKDDATDEAPLLTHFPKPALMPHNSRGQNRFRIYHQLVHCAALNAYTPDIRWMETALGIDARTQRIARTGQEVYQTIMRLSLREPASKHDVSVVVMDREVAEWLPQWFDGTVEVIEIDSSGVVRPKGRPGRPRLRAEPMTAAERQARRRRRLRGEE
jgi:hypothetical protein